MALDKSILESGFNSLPLISTSPTEEDIKIFCFQFATMFENYFVAAEAGSYAKPDLKTGSRRAVDAHQSLVNRIRESIKYSNFMEKMGTYFHNWFVEMVAWNPTDTDPASTTAFMANVGSTVAPYELDNTMQAIIEKAKANPGVDYLPEIINEIHNWAFGIYAILNNPSTGEIIEVYIT